MYSNHTQASPLKNSLKKALSAFSLAVIALTVFAANVATASAASISSFSVVQSSFNPDNESANISFNLTNSANITLEVFDGSNPIRTLAFRQPVSAGQHNEYTWDGKKTDGTKVPAGTYKVQLFYYSDTFALFADDTVSVTYSGGGTTTGNVITNIYDTPDPFDPDVESTKIYYTLTQPANLTLTIKNSQNTTVRTLLNSSYKSSGSTYTSWNGKDTNGNKVAEGQYKYTLTATGSFDAQTYYGYVNVDYEDGGSGVSPVISSDYASPTPFDPNNENTYVYFTLNTESAVTIEIYKGSSYIDTLISNNTLSAGSHTKVWDGRNSSNNIVSEGAYTYKITAQNSYDTDVETGSFEVLYDDVDDGLVDPNITNAYASPTTFDPSDNEDTTVHFTVNTCVYMTAKVYRQSNDSLVKTLSSSEYMCDGTHTISWDGRDSSGNVLSDGDYYIRITVVNSKGDDFEDETVTIDKDNDDPDPVSLPKITNIDVNPYSFNPEENEYTTLKYTLDKCADVTIKVYDDDNYLVDTLKNNVYQCSGNFNVNWDGEDSYNDIVDDGVYKFEIKARNSAGTTTKTSYAEVDTDDDSSDSTNKPSITNITVNPDVFDPVEENSVLKFKLDRCAYTTVKVVDDDDRTARTLLNNVEICSGYHTYSWTGKNTSGNYVNDGDYEFVITSKNSYGTVTKRADVEVDSNGSSSSPRCAGYEDVSETNPYCDAIEYVTEEGIFSGYPDGTFKPYQFINRAETTKVILIGFDYGIMSSDGTNLGFSDVSVDAWYMPYLRTARHYGIVQGYPDGTFKPANTVNRVELLKLFLETADVSVPACTSKPYNDTPESEWYSKYVCYAKKYDLMEADIYNNFNPSAPMSRGDVAELFYRFYEEGLYDYVGTSGTSTVSGAPDISGVSLSVDEVRQGGSVKITYKLNVKADVTVQILDDNNNVVRTLIDDVNQSSGTHSTTWNTKDDDGDNVSEGTYTVKIRASNSKGTDKVLKDLEVDNSASTSTGIRITGLDTDRTVWNPVTQGSLEISFTTNKTATVTVAVYDEDNDLVRYLWDSVSRSADDYEILWNGKDRYNNLVSDGDYTIKVTAKTSTETVKDEVDVEVDR